MFNNKKIVAVIQARLGSTRLPKKVIKPIVNKPMLFHIIERLKYSKYIDNIVVSTSTKKYDDELVGLLDKQNITYSRGDLDDIVQRLSKASKVNNIKYDALVRIWGDCPCIDPTLVDKGIEQYCINRYKFLGTMENFFYPVGLNFQIWDIKILKDIYATRDEFLYEFPQEYVKKYLNKTDFGDLYCDKDYSNIYLTVDYEDDFKLIKKIFENLYQEDRCFSWQDIIRFLDKEELTNNKLIRNIEYKEKKEKWQG